MKDFNTFFNEQMAHPEVAYEYYRLAPFFRLAEQLVLLRKNRGYSQQELAEKALTTQAVVSRLENVSVRCSLDTIVRLAQALDAIVEVRLIPFDELETPDGKGQQKRVDENINSDSNSDTWFVNDQQKAIYYQWLKTAYADEPSSPVFDEMFLEVRN